MWLCLCNNEYKVLGMYIYKLQYIELYIYTLGSGLGWRNLGKFNSEFKYLYPDQASFVNGAFYWVGYNLKIITFDLAEEKFREHLSPPPLPPDSYYYGIGVLDGFLFFSAIILGGEAAECFEIWLLKKKNDNHDMKEREEHHSLSWTKEFGVKKSSLLAVTKSGGLLTYFSNYLNIYNIEASTSRRLVDFKERLRQVFPHMNTLVSLKELGEGDAKIMESVETGNQPASTSASQPALGG